MFIAALQTRPRWVKVGLVVLTLGGPFLGLIMRGGYVKAAEYVQEGDTLITEAKYQDAKVAYEQAGRYWPPKKRLLALKIEQAETLFTQEEAYKAGETYKASGEWQSCVDAFATVTDVYSKFGEAAAAAVECQAKLALVTQPASIETSAAPAPNSAAKKIVTKSSDVISYDEDATSASEPDSGAVSDSEDDATPAPVESPSEDVPAPTLSLPYSTSSNAPDLMTPMGETIYHPDPPNPGGHPGIDFQWSNPSTIPTIIASMDGSVVAISNNTSHSGTFDVLTTNGKWGVDYTELGGVRDGLSVGDTIKVGDAIGTPQHPSSITDQPNFRMLHWQFGYSRGSSGVGTRLCPLSYFASSARSSIESLWANTSAPELKANAPDICSGQYT